jgi:hypothetical protein
MPSELLASYLGTTYPHATRLVVTAAGIAARAGPRDAVLTDEVQAPKPQLKQCSLQAWNDRSFRTLTTISSATFGSNLDG